ncbi:hypothetical protein JCM2811A_06810 [Methylorubrum rhodinum]
MLYAPLFSKSAIEQAELIDDPLRLYEILDGRQVENVLRMDRDCRDACPAIGHYQRRDAYPHEPTTETIQKWRENDIGPVVISRVPLWAGC